VLRELTLLWSRLHDAEYLHLALESLPLFGLGFGLLFLIVATAMGEAKCRLVALVVIAASCASVGPYVKLRTQSMPRILVIYDKAFHAEIVAQAQRRSDSVWYYYAMTGLSLLTLVLGGRGRFSLLVMATLACGALMFLYSAWLHRKECEVFHPNVVRAAPR
jgi:hypothetical protein